MRKIDVLKELVQINVDTFFSPYKRLTTFASIVVLEILVPYGDWYHYVVEVLQKN